MAAYAAVGGMEAHVFMPKDAPIANKIECQAYGARLTLVDGFITDAGQMSQRAAEELGLFDVSTLREPYRAEGKKTMGYEIVEQLGFEVPDVIVYPTGGGNWHRRYLEGYGRDGTVGLDRFGTSANDLCVQADGCAPLVEAFHKGEEFATPFPDPHTMAAGLRVPAAIGDFLVIRAVQRERRYGCNGVGR